MHYVLTQPDTWMADESLYTQCWKDVDILKTIYDIFFILYKLHSTYLMHNKTMSDFTHKYTA